MAAELLVAVTNRTQAAILGPRPSLVIRKALFVTRRALGERKSGCRTAASAEFPPADLVSAPDHEWEPDQQDEGHPLVVGWCRRRLRQRSSQLS